MFLLRSLDPQTNWTAAKASEYFTPLLVEIPDGSSPAKDDIPPDMRNTGYSTSPNRQSKSKVRRRLGLPLRFEGGTGPTTVLTCPDSGSDWNVMAFETAGSLGYPIELHDDSNSTQFVLANGGTVNSIGKISAKCAFTTGASGTELVYECMFFVFKKLAVPIIMGMGFLEKTETLSKHRDRLVEEIVPILQNFRVQAVGQQKKSLVCRLDSHVGCANPDTGSDLDLVSYQYAKTRFKIEPAKEAVMFADGSIDYTCGFFHTSFTVGDVADDSEFTARGKTLSLAFHVLDGLTSDILVGQDTLEMLSVFAEHTASFIPCIPRLGGSDLNIIQLISNFESSTRDRLRDAGRWVSSVLGRNTNFIQTSTMSLEQRLDLEDQRENARAETPTPVTNGFQCTFPNCNAPPFDTQYLLNSHANVHFQDRPHYCPVSGCPRGPGGRGFKRKNEMIRHGLVHDSPGYTCPFCTDQEAKYPRPDNLMR